MVGVSVGEREPLGDWVRVTEGLAEDEEVDVGLEL